MAVKAQSIHEVHKTPVNKHINIKIQDTVKYRKCQVKCLKWSDNDKTVGDLVTFAGKGVPRGGGPVRKEPSRCRQTETRQLQHSRPRGNSARHATRHCATGAKRRAKRLRGSCREQSTVHVYCVAAPNYVTNTGPAERSESGGDVVKSA